MLLLYPLCSLPWRYYQTSMNFTRCAFGVSDGRGIRTDRGGGVFGNCCILGVLLNSQADTRLDRSVWSLFFPLRRQNSTRASHYVVVPLGCEAAQEL